MTGFRVDRLGRPSGEDLIVPVIDLNDPNPTLVETSDPGILGTQRDILLEVLGVSRLSSFVAEIGEESFIYGGWSPAKAATIQSDGPGAAAGRCVAGCGGA